MRVISGNKRGLKLKAPEGDKTRPTEDRVKENIFNSLGQIFYNSEVLDLFAGTGQIGIEFLSRGAKEVIFVEKDKKVISILKENLTKSGYSAKIIEKDTLIALKQLNLCFDYIFMDPPYDDAFLYKEVAENIFKYKLLKDEGILIVEERTADEHDFSHIFDFIKKKKYGSTTVTYWRKR